MENGILIALLAGSPSTLVAIVLGYKEWRSGSSNISKEVIANYKNLDEQQKKEIEEYKIELAEATATIRQADINSKERVAHFEGIILAKDKQIEDLTKINANRNPELEKVLTDIRNFMQQIMETNIFQTDILQKQQIRNKKIDEASDNHVGEVLRKPVGAIEQ